MSFVLSNKEMSVIEARISEQKERTYLGSYRMSIDGGSLWRLCLKSSEVSKVRLVSSETKGEAEGLFIEPHSVYVEALNRKNAINKFKKGKCIFVT